ncbi:hypothetical protein JCM5350_002290 [Sporobolomyces pararoseus]
MSDVPLDLSSLNLHSEPSPPTRYFDLLPPELVISIVEHTSPSQNNVDNERDRRETLRALCLTSRCLRSIAQPLLLSYLYFTYEKHVDQLVVNNSAEALASIRTMDVVPFTPMPSLAKLARAATKLDVLSLSGGDAYLVPFIGSEAVPIFRFQHLESMELLQCSFDQQIRFDLPSLRHLVHRNINVREVTGNHFFLKHVARDLVSISVSVRISLPDSILNNPSISRRYFADVLQVPPPISQIETAHVLHLNTTALVWTRIDNSVVKHIEDWINLLDVSVRPQFLLLDKVNVAQMYMKSIRKLEDCCQRRGIEVVWEELGSISPTFKFGSARFLRWSEERYQRGGSSSGINRREDRGRSEKKRKIWALKLCLFL